MSKGKNKADETVQGALEKMAFDETVNETPVEQTRGKKAQGGRPRTFAEKDEERLHCAIHYSTMEALRMAMIKRDSPWLSQNHLVDKAIRDLLKLEPITYGKPPKREKSK